jgi:hypothetical protein
VDQLGRSQRLLDVRRAVMTRTARRR